MACMTNKRKCLNASTADVSNGREGAVSEPLTAAPVPAKFDKVCRKVSTS
jgi:hypothetical protein